MTTIDERAVPFAEPMFSCQNEQCALECTYPADMLKIHPINFKPICENCWSDDEANYVETDENGYLYDWENLSDINPLAWYPTWQLEAEIKRRR